MLIKSKGGQAEVGEKSVLQTCLPMQSVWRFIPFIPFTIVSHFTLRVCLCVSVCIYIYSINYTYFCLKATI